MRFFFNTELRMENLKNKIKKNKKLSSYKNSHKFKFKIINLNLQEKIRVGIGKKIKLKMRGIENFFFFF